MMEYKSRLLTPRQRLAGVPDEVFQGIESMASKTTRRGRTGVPQLAANVGRLLGAEPRVVSGGDTFDLAGCTKLYPVLVLFDEGLGVHAVRRFLQDRFDEAMAKSNVSSDRVGPLMLLTVRDVETLAIAGHSLSVEKVLDEYGRHLLSQPGDYTGSFHSFLRFTFGETLQPEKSLTYQEHVQALEELQERFTNAGEGGPVLPSADSGSDHEIEHPPE